MTNRNINKAELYFSDIDKWENGDLGDNEEFDKPSIMHKDLRELLNGHSKETTVDHSDSKTMQLISMRLPTTLIEDLKAIGEVENLGYQTLAREVLTRFVESESRRKINELLSEHRRMKQEIKNLKRKNNEDKDKHDEEKLA